MNLVVHATLFKVDELDSLNLVMFAVCFAEKSENLYFYVVANCKSFSCYISLLSSVLIMHISVFCRKFGNYSVFYPDNLHGLCDDQVVEEKIL
ncbi:hypothetical protein AQUCO_02900029v1 [Aquilegia coerulea]|uniref:Uncharacterized protein n=1 Tax=Aquilegia coerulea TaxID=218851 RepID=A0A2G5D308_AQUCA|nr:hypothetical protein AQUCO_02900029v1 [Aquilegia coerulea]